MNFIDWIEINEIKAPKKAKISVVAHSDIDRWLKSVDGFARDLQDLKKAKEKSQAKLDQIKKKFDPEKKLGIEKPTPEVEKPDADEPQSEPLEKDQKQNQRIPKQKEIVNDRKQLPPQRVRARKAKVEQPESDE